MVTRTRIRVAIAIVLLLGVWLGVQYARWSGSKGAERAHRKFLSEVSGRNWGKCHRMIARDYSDRWEYDREAVSLALRDFGGEFIFSLQVDWEAMSTTRSEGGAWELTGLMKVSGRGTPIAELILSEAPRYTAEPFTFRWRKRGWLPWSWKLEWIDHPTAQPPPGYEPGQLRNATSPF